MDGRAALISIRPCYAEKIVSGEKRIEFRRTWAIHPVRSLLIYSSSPVKCFVAIAVIKKITVGSPGALWTLSQTVGGGISRKSLFEYLAGKRQAFGIELTEVQTLLNPISPKELLGRNFRPPQSYYYLETVKFLKLKKKLLG